MNIYQVQYEIFYPKSSNVVANDLADSLDQSKIGNISSYLRSVTVKGKTLDN